MSLSPKLTGTLGPVKDQSWEISSNPLTIGSGDNCRLRQTEAGLEPVHFLLALMNGSVLLTSIAGETSVNGVPARHAKLRDGDEISAGKCKFAVYLAPRSRSIKINLADTPRPAQGPSGPKQPELNLLVNKPLEKQRDVTMRILLNPIDKAAAPTTSVVANRFFFLYQAARQLNNAQTEEQILYIAMSAIFQAMPARQGCVLLYDADGKLLESRVSWTAKTGPCPIPDAVQPSRTLLETALRTRTVCVTRNAEDPRFSAAMSMRQASVQSALCVPIFYKGKTLGALYLDSAQPAAYLKEDADFCELLAGNMAAAISNKRLESKVLHDESIRRQLSRYLPFETVENIIANKESGLPASQHKEITVLFSDFKGFTAAASGLKPEKVLEMLNLHFSVLVEIVFRHGGILDKFLGDGLMALFGVRKDGSEHALAAARCALEMRQCLTGRTLEHGIQPLPLSIGINTGEVVIGDVGSATRTDYTAIGDTVNMAARIVALAQSNEILVSARTMEAAGGSLISSPMQPVKVKGKNEEIQLYSLRGIQGLENRP